MWLLFLRLNGDCGKGNLRFGSNLTSKKEFGGGLTTAANISIPSSDIPRLRFRHHLAFS